MTFILLLMESFELSKVDCTSLISQLHSLKNGVSFLISSAFGVSFYWWALTFSIVQLLLEPVGEKVF